MTFTLPVNGNTVTYDGSNFFVLTQKGPQEIQQGDLSRELRGISVDDLFTRLKNSYLVISNTGRDFSLKLLGRLRGGSESFTINQAQATFLKIASFSFCLGAIGLFSASHFCSDSNGCIVGAVTLLALSVGVCYLLSKADIKQPSMTSRLI